MIVFPLVAAGVSAVFAVLLFLQWNRRRRWPQFCWGVAMAMFAVASIAVAFGVSGGWTSPIYKVYWLFGALLNVPWLALGSIALLNRRILTLAGLVLVIAGSAFAFWKVATGDVNPFIENARGQRKQVLGTTNIPRGSEAWFGDQSVRSLASWYSIPAYFVVVGIAVYTSRARNGVRPSAERVRGNMLIAAGTTIVALGGTAIARFGSGAPFSITLAIGVGVMFVGFLLASRAPHHRVEQPGESPT